MIAGDAALRAGTTTAADRDPLTVVRLSSAAFVDAFPPAPGPGLSTVDRLTAADGTRVVTRSRSRQAPAKDVVGVKAAGREILFDETHVARLAGGLIIENVVSATNLEFEMPMAPVLAPLVLK